MIYFKALLIKEQYSNSPMRENFNSGKSVELLDGDGQLFGNLVLGKRHVGSFVLK